MNITLVYESTNYKFDLTPSRSILYIKDLACRLFNLKKTSTELVYNNKTISKTQPNMQIKSLFPSSDTAHIINVQSDEEKIKKEVSKKKIKEIKVNFQEYNTKYKKEIQELKEKIIKSDESYQELFKDISLFKDTLEITVKKLTEIIQQFKDNAILLDNLLNNEKEFDDMKYIKADIMNFHIESDDNENFKKIKIFNQKINGYEEKYEKSNFRKKYQQFIQELLGFQLTKLAKIDMSMVNIHEHSNKNKYYTEIDHLISSFSYNEHNSENSNQEVISLRDKIKILESRPQTSKKIIQMDYQINNVIKNKEQKQQVGTTKKSKRRYMITLTDNIEPKPMNNISRNKQFPTNDTPSNRTEKTEAYHNMKKEQKNYSIDISSKRIYPIKTHVPHQLSTLTNPNREHFPTETYNTVEDDNEDTVKQSNLPKIMKSTDLRNSIELCKSNFQDNMFINSHTITTNTNSNQAYFVNTNRRKKKCSPRLTNLYDFIV